jgi:cation:H+ antiporter
MPASTGAAMAVFWPAAVLSLAASAVLVTRLERLGARVAMPEALLGLVVALAADAPEISSAVAATASGQRGVGTGVILGSNAFNLAALLGLAAIVAGQIRLHRRVVLLEGSVAIWLAAVSITLMTGAIDAVAALILGSAVLIPYVVISSVHPHRRTRLPVPRRAGQWLAAAVSEEELELVGALRARKGGAGDVLAGLAALAVVVTASALMERAGAQIGARYALPDIVTGGLLLAAVTSLPNMVSAIYLAARGRASATLSTALNSNTLNVVAGLLIPAAIAGTTVHSAGATVTAAWYGGLTLCVVGLAWAGRGLDRRAGLAIVVIYLAIVPALLAG